MAIVIKNSVGGAEQNEKLPDNIVLWENPSTPDPETDTYKRMLKDEDGNNIIPVTNIIGTLSDVGFMYVKAKDGGNPTAQDTIISFSSTDMGTKTLIYEYDPLSCLQLSAGTCYYTHKKDIKMLEVEMHISMDGFAFWLQGTNANPLNGAVMIAGKNMLPKVSGNSGWGGSYCKVYYDVSSMNEGDSFFINPEVTVYGGAAKINRSGTEGFLSVKVLCV